MIVSEESLGQQLQQPSPSTFHSLSEASVPPHLRHAHQHGHHHPTGIGNFEPSSSPQHFQTSSESSPSSSSSNSSLLSNIISTSWRSIGSSNSSFNNNNNNFTFPTSSTGYKLLNDDNSDSVSGGPGSSLGLVFPFNLSSTEMGEIENIYNTTSLLNNSEIAQNSSSNPDPHHFLSSLYSIIVPVMVFFCVLTCLVNLVIVLSARWCRKPMSPTLYFSISLALADAYASFILGTGLVINSLLPQVYNIKWHSQCVLLTLEVLRQGGVLVTVCHLLALGINHWIGIVRPLHYAATMTRRTAWIVIILSWICPILMLFIYYSSISEEGYLSPDCKNNTFLANRTYRGFFASCFFAPLLLMSLIYIHIFLIVRNHHSNRLRYQSCHQLQRNVKAVLTTILILGTYVIGWMPAIIFSIVVCDDCLLKLGEIPMEIRYAAGITVNTLIILKCLLNPIIYAARMSDIQLSLKKMRYAFLQMFCKCCVNPLPPADNERGSLYDTKSVRMSSFGSSSSSRRTAAAASTNLMNNSPGHQQSNHTTGYNNSINYKNHNNGNNTSNHHSHPKSSQKLHNKSAFEMTEMH